MYESLNICHTPSVYAVIQAPLLCVWVAGLQNRRPSPHLDL